MKATTASANAVSKFSKQFTIVVGIYDAKTQIYRTSVTTEVVCRTSWSAENLALTRAKQFATREFSMPYFCKKYGLDEWQFRALHADGEIRTLESFTFKVESVEVTECQTR